MELFETGPAFGRQDLARYRSLAFRLSSDRSMAEWYGIQAVGIGPAGLIIFVKSGSAFQHRELQRVAGVQDVKIEAIGPIEPSGGCGARIDAKSGPWGTFGCVVEDDRGQEYALSCDHVVGREAKQTVGDDVLCGMSKLGTFERGSAIVISAAANNASDAALIRPIAGTPLNRAIKGLSIVPRGVNRALVFGDTLHKSGARTKVTSGRFTYIVTMMVPYASGAARFVDQIGIDGGGMVFSDKGDSGAVVLDGQNRVAGLLFASAPKRCLGFANPIADVETALGVSVP